MKLDILLYIESEISDDELIFMDHFLPERLSENLQVIDKVEKIYYSVPERYEGKLSKNKNSFTRKSNDDVDFWKEIFSKTESEQIAKIFADSPFLDTSIIKEMIDLHFEYLAEFTFSENLPKGFSCEIVSKELIKSIPDFEGKTLPLNKVIKSNINQFDIELYYKDPDIRDKRISFLLSNLRDKRIMENIFRLSGKIPAYTELKNIINNNPDALYISPSYIEIELTGRCELDCIFCYRKTLDKTHDDIDIDLFKKIIYEMKSFNIPYSVCFGGSGEPMMHPKFYEIIELTNSEPQIENIIVETNGLYMDSNYKNFIENTGSKIKTIININGMDSETYKSLHGEDFFEKVYQNIVSLKELNVNNKRVYIQIMKINETETFLDKYYDFWENLGFPIILQKQNDYLGIIEDRSYSDLSPLDRVPCWHLQRDINITSDGLVIFCKQDVDGKFSADNINDKTVPEIWEKRKENFLNDYRKDYSSAPDCRSCDEWYTFNF